MSDDFLRLVSQANPAASSQQYQPANSGYPPAAGLYSDNQSSPSNPQLLDPFFDDDDEHSPDMALGRPIPMQSKESGLPLTRSAAPPAGTKAGAPQGWDFDDDEFRSGPFAGSVALEPSPSPMLGPTKPNPPARRRRKWPWQKEQVLAGERVIALNNPAGNVEFSNNFVSTSKYNFFTFLPKFLLGGCRIVSSRCMILTTMTEQFSKYANLFFLFTACIQQIPDVSPTNPYTTIIPLSFVLLASAFKEVQEDAVSVAFCL